MNYVTRFFIAKEKYVLEEAAYLVALIREKKVLDADLERLLEYFDNHQAVAIASLDDYVASLQTDSTSAPKQ